MKVCVLGTGSLGSTIGGALAKAGNEVHFVGRQAHMDAVNENGLLMVTPTGEEVAHPVGHTDPAGIGPCDLVIVLCKAFDTKATMEEGKELGYGGHEHLLKTCSVYQEIARSQMGSGPSTETVVTACPNYGKRSSEAETNQKEVV